LGQEHQREEKGDAGNPPQSADFRC
jgi:hypothetical protein